MRRFNILLFLLVVCFATAMRAQTHAPELKKLAVVVGHWTYELEYKPGPLGPGGKFTGDATDQMTLGGFFLQERRAEKGAMGETGALEITGYDPVNKNFTVSGYEGDGNTYSGVLTVNGNTWTYTGKFVVAGKQYLFKDTFILAPDLMSAIAKAEISADGNTWTPWFEGKYTKAKPAPKK